MLTTPAEYLHSSTEISVCVAGNYGLAKLTHKTTHHNVILLDLVHAHLPHLFSSLSSPVAVSAPSLLALCQLASCHLSSHERGIFPTPFLENSCCLYNHSGAAYSGSLPCPTSAQAPPWGLGSPPLSLKPDCSHEIETTWWPHGRPLQHANIFYQITLSPQIILSPDWAQIPIRNYLFTCV